MNIVKLFSGEFFDILNPDPKKIFIGDIAQSLSNQCRFGGQSDIFYSVAEHSVWVSRQLEGFGPQWQLMGLLHDAPKAYLGEIQEPVKELIPDIEAIEQNILDAVFQASGLPQGQLPAPVKRANRYMLAVEARDFMNASDEELEKVWKLAPPPSDAPAPKGLLPHDAHGLFTSEYAKILGVWDA